MRRNVPLGIALVAGIIALSTSYLQSMQPMYRLLLQWSPIVIGFAFFLGILSFCIHHWTKVKRKVPGWGFNVASLVAFFTMLGAGVLARFVPGTFGELWGISKDSSIFQWMFNYLLVPMEATMFALLAFYIASASFRAFRARNIEATLLLIAGILIMIGKVPLSELVWSGFSDVQEWIQEFPNTAAKRAIMIGVGLGMASTALKLILGIERSYLGRGE